MASREELERIVRDSCMNHPSIPIIDLTQLGERGRELMPTEKKPVETLRFNLPKQPAPISIGKLEKIYRVALKLTDKLVPFVHLNLLNQRIERNDAQRKQDYFSQRISYLRQVFDPKSGALKQADYYIQQNVTIYEDTKKRMDLGQDFLSEYDSMCERLCDHILKLEEQARTIYDRYCQNIGPGAAANAVKNVRIQISKYQTEIAQMPEWKRCVEEYVAKVLTPRLTLCEEGLNSARDAIGRLRPRVWRGIDVVLNADVADNEAKIAALCGEVDEAVETINSVEDELEKIHQISVCKLNSIPKIPVLDGSDYYPTPGIDYIDGATPGDTEYDYRSQPTVPLKMIEGEKA